MPGPAPDLARRLALLDAVETPAVVVDIARAEANIDRAQAAADAAGLRLRPHVKTHKLPRLARAQIARGAVGITCQKLGEAEVMAEAGIDDILLTYNIVGPAKLARLRALAGRSTLAATADHETVVRGYAAAFADAPGKLRVLVECDTGMGRCGVQSPREALALARAIAAAPGLAFGGLMTYPAAGDPDGAAARLAETAALLAAEGLAPATVSTGGTPDLWRALERPGPATEYRPGTYVYMDRSQVAAGAASLEDCALHVLATVVSTPAPGRAVIDAGSKSLTSDTLGLQGFGHVATHPEARILSLSEEHGVMDVSRCPEPPAIGTRLLVVPNHACTVVNLFDAVLILERDGGLTPTPVAARGRVT